MNTDQWPQAVLFGYTWHLSCLTITGPTAWSQRVPPHFQIGREAFNVFSHVSVLFVCLGRIYSFLVAVESEAP